MTLQFAKPDLMSDEINGLAVILQTKEQNLPAKILGAASWMNKGS